MHGLLDVQLMWISAIVGAGILNGLLFSKRLLSSGSGSMRYARHFPLAAFIFSAAVACLSMTFLPKTIGYPLEVISTFVAAPLLFWTVCSYCKTKTSISVMLLIFIFSIACLYWFSQQSWLSVSVYNQWLFTLAAWLVFFKSIHSMQRTHYLLTLCILAGMTVIHAIQALRIVEYTGDGLPGLVVPMVIAVLIILMSHNSERLKPIVKTRKMAPQASQEETRILESISSRIIQPKLFLDPDLNLKTMAAKISEPVHLISAAINNHYECRVDQLINRLRLQHAKMLLSDPNELKTSIEAIALLSGFNSRSAFYEAFKKEQGITPAAYRKIK